MGTLRMGQGLLSPAEARRFADLEGALVALRAGFTALRDAVARWDLKVD